jgi:putative FmdB family regulatory protein
MPFYEYECQSCKYYVEVMQKITDAPLKKCPSCGRMTLRKLVSAPVFRLKGSGWYETDFKSSQESKRNLAATERDSRTPESPAAPAAGATPAPAKADASTPAAKPAAPSAEADRPARKPARATARAPASRPKARVSKPAAKRRSRS